MSRHLQGLGIETITHSSGQATLSLALELKPIPGLFPNMHLTRWNKGTLLAAP
jgi:hypothetical protein